MTTGRVVRRYHFALQSGSLSYADSRMYVEGEAEEQCEPDEWGEPGRVVSRRWLWIRDRNGQDVMRRLNTHHIDSLHAAPATWADADD